MSTNADTNQKRRADNPSRIPSSFRDVASGSKVKDSPKTHIAASGRGAQIHVLGIDRPRLATKRHCHLDVGVAC